MEVQRQSSHSTVSSPPKNTEFLPRFSPLAQRRSGNGRHSAGGERRNPRLRATRRYCSCTVVYLQCKEGRKRDAAGLRKTFMHTRGMEHNRMSTVVQLDQGGLSIRTAVHKGSVEGLGTKLCEGLCCGTAHGLKKR